MTKNDFLDDIKEWNKKDKDLKNHYINEPEVKALLDEHKDSNSSFVQSLLKFAKERGFITDKQFKALEDHEEYDPSDYSTDIYGN